MDQLLSQLLNLIFTILGAAVTASLPWLFSWLKDHVKSEQSKKLIDQVAQLADWAVHEVQPAGSEHDNMSNQAKKQAAVSYVKDALSKHGLSVSDETISGAIESAVAGMHLGWEKVEATPKIVNVGSPITTASDVADKLGPFMPSRVASESALPSITSVSQSASASVSTSASDSDFHLGGDDDGDK